MKLLHTFLILIPLVTQCYHDKDYGKTDSLFNIIDTWLHEPTPVPTPRTEYRVTKINTVVSEPADIYDYYEYDSVRKTWIWSDKKPKTAKPKPKIKKQISPVSEYDTKPVSWVIFARGISKDDLKKRFPNLEKNYEICRFDRKAVKLECAPNR